MDWTPSRPVPVFPLPEVVLFPRARLPLHVFELRYRTMVRDALSGERLIAMATLAPGWERDYHASPEFLPLGCVGRLDRVEWLPNDCYQLQLLGLVRVRFGRVEREFPYRACRLEALPEHPYAEDDPLVRIERQAVWDAYRALAARSGAAPALPDDSGADFATLVNLVCTFTTLPMREKLALLALDSVIERGRRVREAIERRLRDGVGLPPPANESGGEHN